MPSNIVQSIKDFFSSVWEIISDGLLLFGGPVDTFLAIVDILATTLVIYYLLKLMRETRAWQLLKGILLIFAFAIFAGIIGLDTIGFLLNRTISLFAIAFVVIFQPELRRALETFGRSSFNVIASTFSVEGRPDSIHQLIEAIVTACEQMSKERTGALIIIERTTKLRELQEQENAVLLDAQVTSSLLQQIFYTGSPLHDGAVLVRHGRVAAARVHVPLTDNYHLRRDFGTRHRAAVGASEMGDAISVVVSEERGTISLGIGGRLYVLSSADALRNRLHRLLSFEPEEKRTGLGRLLGLRQKKSEKFEQTESEKFSAADLVSETVAEHAAESAADAADSRVAALSEQTNAVAASFSERFQVPADSGSRLSKKRKIGFDRRKKRKFSIKKHQVLLAVVSLLIGFSIWFYVQMTVNPIKTRDFNVQLQYRGEEIAADNGYGIQSFPLVTVQVRLKGRDRILQDLSANDIVAFVDLGQISEPGIQSLPVQIDADTVFSTYTEQLLPGRITVNVFSEDNP
ncbi:MAG: diadenylate cyclase CdaA [Saccharofermentanales bacterium]|nr:diadenylate cyclase CdaA [Bacillota bacterium]NLB08574.1 TIGR00159 family protein [Clostridiales bacterium]